LSALNGNRPSVAIFCATYLRPEMLHIHRHIAGLKNFPPVVITQKRDGDWPVERIRVVPRSPFRFVSRGIERLGGQAWQISAGEARRIGEAAADASLLHIFFGNVAVHLLPLLRRARIPAVVSFHGSDVAGAIATSGYGEARREMFERSRLVLCRSEQLAEKVAGLGCDPGKLRIMKTVLPEIGFVDPTPPTDGQWQMVQACRLVPKKGLATSLRAFAIFSKTFPGARFTIAGEGPMEEELRGLASSLGIADRVSLTGFLPQESLRQLYSRSHFFLHPSETADGDVEGIPNSLLEAMASGLPAVATRHGGIPEVVVDGIAGLLCEERDHAAVAAALVRMASDSVLYRKIARAGSDSIRDQFSAERRIAEIEALYREACGIKP
jgi:glycosyltransferase involved in cell wall biosynthesis